MAHLLFLYLPSPQLAYQRVVKRVQAGGHDVPKHTVFRRYHVGLSNLFSLYLPLADRWQVWNTAAMPELVAEGGQSSTINIHQAALWRVLEERYAKKDD